MGAPQVIMIVLLALGSGLSWAQHKKPREPNNAWVQLASTLIVVALLWWGGFWGRP